MFQFITKRKYLRTILDSFPSYLDEDVREVFSVLNLDNAFKSSIHGSCKVDSLISKDSTSHLLQKEDIRIPTRIYFNEPSLSDKSTLSEIQLTILNCILSRSANGYIREQSLQELNSNYTDWIVPYIILAVGDYVVEVLIELESQLNEDNIQVLKNYIKQNPKIWKLQKQRIVSYWDLYYRDKYPELSEYVGGRIVEKIGL